MSMKILKFLFNVLQQNPTDLNRYQMDMI